MSIIVDDTAVKRLEHLRSQQNNENLKLRITVDSGGCSGFQYLLKLDDTAASDDHSFENTVITDDISLPFLEGATVRFDDEIVGAQFVIDNPNAVSGCGCGTSFSIG